MKRLVAIVIAVAGCGNGSNPMSQNCDLSSATPTMHTSITGSETWASGVHQVPSTLTVPVGATLTVSACSRVELAADAGLTVNGALVVAGTAAGPVSFVGSSSAPWGTIQLNPNGTADLAYTKLDGGGGATGFQTSGTLGAPIYVHGVPGPPTAKPLKVAHVDVEHATGVGIALVGAGFADGSTDLTVSTAGAYPVYLGADVVDTLPDGKYTGNGGDVIQLQSAFFAAQDNQRPITHDLTIHNRGVPYCAGMKEPGVITIGDPSIPLVTIEPGVAIGFPKGTTAGGRFRILADNSGATTVALGALSAVGTAANHIVFTSCEGSTAAAGDWIGLMFNGVDPRTQLQYVEVDDAGADSGVVGVCLTVNNTGDADAAVQILVQKGDVTAPFIANSVIAASASSGIYRGWNGSNTDFLAGNTLMQIAWCAETLVPDLSNACPNMACPTAP